MSSVRARSLLWGCGLLLACLGALAPPRVWTQGSQASSTDASLAAYRAHLDDLDKLIASCKKARTAQACDPAQVGPDAHVQLKQAGISVDREVRYDWLRLLLEKAGREEQSRPVTNGPGPVVKTPALSVDAQLQLAQERLANDAKQAESPASARPDYTTERKALAAILARKEYRGVSETSAKERFLEWLANAVDSILGHIAHFGRRSPWIGFVLRLLVFAAIGVGLVWALIRMERRSRTRLVPELQAAAGTPSAREWQLWREDALAMAGQGRWREAIHFLYWAAISRLESRHVWPADRARTPREYLGLVPAADNRKSTLATLTRSFERTWYGGREASSSDFQTAMKLAAELGVE